MCAAPGDVQGADGGAPLPPARELAVRDALSSALAKGDLEEQGAEASAAEQLAPASPDAATLWLLAARARRARTDALAARAGAAPIEAPPGNSARELLPLLSAEASACAADAHRSWSQLLPAAAASIDAGAPPAIALAAAPASCAEPLYLDALCSAAWARAQGFTFFVEQRALLEAALIRAATLLPLLDDAGPDRELGRLFASLPGYAGGDLPAARSHFEAAIAAAPQAPWNRVLFARSVAVKLQDRPLFTKLLQEALALPATSPDALAAQAEARSLLDRGDDLFGVAATPH